MRDKISLIYLALIHVGTLFVKFGCKLIRESLLTTTDKKQTRKCTVFPFHPWDAKECRKHGIMLWVPHNIEELIKIATDELDVPSGGCILSEDGGKILDIDMITDCQKLYLVNETH